MDPSGRYLFTDLKKQVLLMWYVQYVFKVKDKGTGVNSINAAPVSFMYLWTLSNIEGSVFARLNF